MGQPGKLAPIVLEAADAVLVVSQMYDHRRIEAQRVCSSSLLFKWITIS